MTVTNSWKFSSPEAELQSGGVSGCVDVSRPELGLHGVVVESQSLPMAFLQVRRDVSGASSSAPAAHERAWPLTVADAYVRGGDLVATYKPTEDWPYSPQIYWRTNESAGATDSSPLGSFALLVSVQTHLLDTRPRIVVGSEMKCAEVLQLTPSPLQGRVGEGLNEAQLIQHHATVQPSGDYCCILRRLAGAPYSYAEMMPASDFHELRISHEGPNDCRVEWELFSDFLEKGVIRRARVEGFLLPRDNDLEAAHACCMNVLQLPLPLTT